ncbi:MAG: hypothetical protein II830_03575 [Alphaproteobacteria bacterium]|nr:hypothetical protein [Alphaproteobacteria bacterium]
MSSIKWANSQFNRLYTKLSADTSKIHARKAHLNGFRHSLSKYFIAVSGNA